MVSAEWPTLVETAAVRINSNKHSEYYIGRKNRFWEGGELMCTGFYPHTRAFLTAGLSHTAQEGAGAAICGRSG